MKDQHGHKITEHEFTKDIGHRTEDLLMNTIKDNQELANHKPIFMTKTTEELVNSFKAELWSWGLTAKDIDVNSFISTLLSKERNEAYEKGFTTGREGVELACKEAMKLNYWDKEKRNEVIDEVKKEVEELYEVCDICENQQQHDTEYNRTIDSVINILENLKVK